MLGLEPWSVGRAASALNHGAISPATMLMFSYVKIMLLYTLCVLWFYRHMLAFQNKTKIVKLFRLVF